MAHVSLDSSAVLSLHELPGTAVSEGVVVGALSTAGDIGGSVEPAIDECGWCRCLGDFEDSVD